MKKLCDFVVKRINKEGEVIGMSTDAATNQVGSGGPILKRFVRTSRIQNLLKIPCPYHLIFNGMAKMVQEGLINDKLFNIHDLSLDECTDPKIMNIFNGITINEILKVKNCRETNVKVLIGNNFLNLSQDVVKCKENIVIYLGYEFYNNILSFLNILQILKDIYVLSFKKVKHDVLGKLDSLIESLNDFTDNDNFKTLMYALIKIRQIYEENRSFSMSFSNISTIDSYSIKKLLLVDTIETLKLLHDLRENGCKEKKATCFGDNDLNISPIKQSFAQLPFHLYFGTKLSLKNLKGTVSEEKVDIMKEKTKCNDGELIKNVCLAAENLKSDPNIVFIYDEQIVVEKTHVNSILKNFY